MKKLVSFLAVSSILLTTSVFADEYAKLRIKISGATNNKHFLCISGMGCISMVAANKGKILPIDGTIGNIIVMDRKNMRMHPQPFPKSCDVTVNNNQTLTISGKLNRHANEKIYLDNLRCSVA